MRFEPSERIATLLDTHTIETEVMQPQRKANSFHASGILECWRKQVYDRLGFSKEITPEVARWLRSRDMGNLSHSYYTELFQNAGVLLAHEMTVPENPWDIGGRIDDILYITDTQVLVDIKTVDVKKFREVPKGDKFRENYAQLQLYLYLLDMHEGILFYVNRSDNETKEFTVLRDPEEIERLLERAYTMKKYYDANIIPPTERSYKCRFCPFQQMCDASGDDAYKLLRRDEE